jgi:hypothetical protein
VPIALASHAIGKGYKTLYKLKFSLPTASNICIVLVRSKHPHISRVPAIHLDSPGARARMSRAQA